MSEDSSQLQGNVLNGITTTTKPWEEVSDEYVEQHFAKPNLRMGEAMHFHNFAGSFGEYYGLSTWGAGGSIGTSVGMGRPINPKKLNIDWGKDLKYDGGLARGNVSTPVPANASTSQYKFATVTRYTMMGQTWAGYSYAPSVTVYMWRRLN